MNFEGFSRDSIIVPDPTEVYALPYDDTAHHQLEERFHKELEEEGYRCKTPVHPPRNGFKVPDITAKDGSSPEESQAYAFEIKVSKVDMERAFYQCRLYKTNLFSPYIVAQKSLLEDIEEKLDIIFDRLPQNTPEIICVLKRRVEVLKHPTYCSMV